MELRDDSNRKAVSPWFIWEAGIGECQEHLEMVISEMLNWEMGNWEMGKENKGR